jgi:hypothetical protein
MTDLLAVAIWVAAYLALCLIAIPVFSTRKRRKK